MFADNVGRFKSVGCGCVAERKQVKSVEYKMQDERLLERLQRLGLKRSERRLLNFKTVPRLRNAGVSE